MSVYIPGRILDEKYTQLVMEQTELSLGDVMLLDCVQKKQPVTHPEYLRLNAARLVEGRYPSIFVAGKFAKATGNAGLHIRERGFYKQYYLDLLMALITEHGRVARADVDQLLLPKLPERLSEDQKRHRARNLLHIPAHVGSQRTSLRTTVSNDVSAARSG